jgi:hypothetical protein
VKEKKLECCDIAFKNEKALELPMTEHHGKHAD